MAYCHNCGSEIVDSETFCRDCGTNIKMTKSEYREEKEMQEDVNMMDDNLEDDSEESIYHKLGFVLGAVVFTAIIAVVFIILFETASERAFYLAILTLFLIIYTRGEVVDEISKGEEE